MYNHIKEKLRTASEPVSFVNQPYTVAFILMYTSPILPNADCGETHPQPLPDRKIAIISSFKECQSCLRPVLQSDMEIHSDISGCAVKPRTDSMSSLPKSKLHHSQHRDEIDDSVGLPRVWSDSEPSLCVEDISPSVGHCAEFQGELLNEDTVEDTVSLPGVGILPEENFPVPPYAGIQPLWKGMSELPKNLALPVAPVLATPAGKTRRKSTTRGEHVDRTTSRDTNDGDDEGYL